MPSKDDFNLDEATVNQLGLVLTDKHVNAQLASHARVFEYPHLDNVFIMESDLYGNKMPKDSCFLAFYGKHGLIGKHLKIDTLRNATVEDIKNLVEINVEG